MLFFISTTYASQKYPLSYELVSALKGFETASFCIFHAPSSTYNGYCMEQPFPLAGVPRSYVVQLVLSLVARSSKSLADTYELKKSDLRPLIKSCGTIEKKLKTKTLFTLEELMCSAIEKNDPTAGDFLASIVDEALKKNFKASSHVHNYLDFFNHYYVVPHTPMTGYTYADLQKKYIQDLPWYWKIVSCCFSKDPVVILPEQQRSHCKKLSCVTAQALVNDYFNMHKQFLKVNCTYQDLFFKWCSHSSTSKIVTKKLPQFVRGWVHTERFDIISSTFSVLTGGEQTIVFVVSVYDTCFNEQKYENLLSLVSEYAALFIE